VFAALAAAHLTTVTAMTGGLILYAFPAVPLVSLLAGDGLVRLVRWARSGVAWPRRGLVVAAALTIALAMSWHVARQRYRERDHRVYSPFPYVRQVQMSRLQRLTVTSRVAELVTPRLREGDTLSGYPTLASAVALELNRRLAGELADLAPRWMQLGLVSRESVIERIEADHVRVFVAQAGSLEANPTFKGYLARCYEPPQVIERTRGEGGGIPRVNVFVHVDGECGTPTRQ